jgi:hypothetical protein
VIGFQSIERNREKEAGKIQKKEVFDLKVKITGLFIASTVILNLTCCRALHSNSITG